MTAHNNKKMMDYWLATAVHDWDTAQALWRAKRYDACLFFCHLVTEKILKAAVVKQTGKPAPRVHDLIKLANLAQLEF